MSVSTQLIIKNAPEISNMTRAINSSLSMFITFTPGILDFTLTFLDGGCAFLNSTCTIV